ncbi:MAG TPA: glycosyltransferase family 39 protein [Candidatus Cybelea sp.]
MRVRVAAIAALVTLVLHLGANPHYGFFRDELYFIICGFHPVWGYVDQPPVVPLLAAGSQLFGHSLFALRAVAAIFAAAGAYVTCLLAFELGGGAFAAALATIAYLAAGVLESFGAKVGPDMVGLWLSPLAALYALRIIKRAVRAGGSGWAQSLALRWRANTAYSFCERADRRAVADAAGALEGAVRVVLRRRAAHGADRAAELFVASRA